MQLFQTEKFIKSCIAKQLTVCRQCQTDLSRFDMGQPTEFIFNDNEMGIPVECKTCGHIEYVWVELTVKVVETVH